MQQQREKVQCNQFKGEKGERNSQGAGALVAGSTLKKSYENFAINLGLKVI